MANEIQFSASMQVTKNGATKNKSVSKSMDQAGTLALLQTISVGTTAQLLVVTAFAGIPKKLIFHNLDATNFVTIGGDSGMTLFCDKITAGDFTLRSPTTATIYLKADTAACLVDVLGMDA